MDTTSTLTGERADLLEALATHRHFLRYTVQGLSEEQARQRTTASELTLGGLVKHVASQEAGWVDFIVNGPAAMASATDPEQMAKWAEEFRLGPDETLDRKSTRLNSSHANISYAVFCLKKTTHVG